MSCPVRKLALAAGAGGAALLLWTLYRNHRLGSGCFAKCCGKPAEENIYETRRSVNEYLLMHFGKDDILMPWTFGPKEALHFPKRIAELCFKYKPTGSELSVLDIGCAVGCMSFHLSSQFDDVLGIDYSQAFIDACNQLKEAGQMDYEALEEGEIYSQHIATVDSALNRSGCRFEQGDACNLRSDLGSFDCVVAANLICRLQEPKRFFDRCSQLVKSGGVLIITSPYTFMEQFTKKAKWVGGFNDSNGKPVRAIDRMADLLGSSFQLEATHDVPFLIRETARKNQWTVAHATIWRKI